MKEITLPFDNLLEAKSYTLYAVLEAVSEIKKTDLLKVLTFTTEIKPTAPATFDHVADYEEGKPFPAGTKYCPVFQSPLNSVSVA